MSKAKEGNEGNSCIDIRTPFLAVFAANAGPSRVVASPAPQAGSSPVPMMYSSSPNYPLSLGTFTITTNRPNIRARKRNSKRIYQKSMVKSSMSLVVMGDGNDVVMIPLREMNGDVTFYGYSLHGEDDLVSCTISYKQFAGE